MKLDIKSLIDMGTYSYPHGELTEEETRKWIALVKNRHEKLEHYEFDDHKEFWYDDEYQESNLANAEELISHRSLFAIL